MIFNKECLGQLVDCVTRAPQTETAVVIDRACYLIRTGRKTRRAKLEPIEHTHLGYTIGDTNKLYDAIKVTIIDDAIGIIDSHTFEFRDTWEKRLVISPNGEWYCVTNSLTDAEAPDTKDFAKLATKINTYTELFYH